MVDALYQAADASLDWLHRHLSLFTLDPGEAGHASLDMGRKRLGELALSLIILSRNQRFCADLRVRDITGFLTELAHSAEYKRNMVRNLNLFPFYLMIGNGLASMGVPLRDQTHKLQQVLDAGYMDCVERTNWAKIDLRYQMDLAGLRHKLASYQQLYAGSSLYHLPSLSHIRTIDVYAITHMLFHMGDFGRVDLVPLLGHRLPPTAEYISLLTGLYLQKEDWDLVAELLICCHCLKYRHFPLFKLSWERLLGSQNEAGDFTSRYIQTDLKLSRLVSVEDRFKVNYHPTLVSLFACLLEIDAHEHGKA